LGFWGLKFFREISGMLLANSIEYMCILDRPILFFALFKKEGICIDAFYVEGH